ncbi:prepilin-type N-terminal cleavage/methylation domain-containing protein [Elusimicrobium simillimum]|uniref:pilin n=1 Tax=Elusimicrobium simillimum TaxID=3143438 RepID=UPI003C700EE8
MKKFQSRPIAAKAAGFTLIELLVVVLIIGILSAIALPQYTKAVEKSRVAEALLVANALNKEVQVAFADRGRNMSCRNFEAFANMQDDPDRPGGYITKNFEYRINDCGSTIVELHIKRIGSKYELEMISRRGGTMDKTCHTNENPLGETICNGLRSDGFAYNDGSL